MNKFQAVIILVLISLIFACGKFTGPVKSEGVIVDIHKRIGNACSIKIQNDRFYDYIRVQNCDETTKVGDYVSIVNEDDGFMIEMPGGVKFSIPLEEESKIKKAA